MKEQIKNAFQFACDLTDHMAVDRTSPYSPTGYGDFYARLNPGVFKGVALCVRVNPFDVTFTIGDYGMSSSHLETIDSVKFSAEHVARMTFEDLVSAVMQLLAKNRRDGK